MPLTAGERPRALAPLAVLLLLVVLTACGGGDDSPVVGSGAPVATTGAGAPAPGSPSTTAAATVLSVTVRGGSVVQGAARQRAPLNQPVTIRVTSDVGDEVHVHGYDKRVEVAPGSTAELTFVAHLPGVFEVELERARKALFSLEVR